MGLFRTNSGLSRWGLLTGKIDPARNYRADRHGRPLDPEVAARWDAYWDAAKARHLELQRHSEEEKRGRAQHQALRPRRLERIPLDEAVRWRIFARDGYRCVLCGSAERLTIDHIHPVIRGGTNAESNLQTLCRSCNSRKGVRATPSGRPLSATDTAGALACASSSEVAAAGESDEAALRRLDQEIAELKGTVTEHEAWIVERRRLRDDSTEPLEHRRNAAAGVAAWEAYMAVAERDGPRPDDEAAAAMREWRRVTAAHEAGDAAHAAFYG